MESLKNEKIVVETSESLGAKKSAVFNLGVSGAAVLETFGFEQNAVAIKVNGEIFSLLAPLVSNSKIEPIFLQSKEGLAIYRRSLCMVLSAATHKIFPGKRLLVWHSLNSAYYYTIDFQDENLCTAENVQKIKNEMLSLVQKNLPIEHKFLPFSSALELFSQLSLTDTVKQLCCKCKSIVALNSIEDFSDLYFGPLVPSTGVLKVFDLIPYAQGFLLRFPSDEKNENLAEFRADKKLFEIYSKSKAWGKRVGVSSAGDLNELVASRKINDFIDIAETFQTQNFSEIAHEIHERGNVRVVLLAGPSSSGKTTSAKKLSLQLLALGYKPKILSLDNYYVGREQNPRDENGEYDYECLEALDVKLLNQNLVELFAGNEVALPKYNFELGERYYDGKKIALIENEILLIEGIHGLNDALTPLIAPEFKFKIYLSALTQLNLNDHHRIPTSDNRLIRRIVRDSRFRGKSAAETISMWDNVRRGERLHIFPFQNNADAILNTALDYELPVLKVYAEPLLQCVRPNQKEYSEAARLLVFLSNFNSFPSASVPKQSILREFIGGSSFHY